MIRRTTVIQDVMIPRCAASRAPSFPHVANPIVWMVSFKRVVICAHGARPLREPFRKDLPHAVGGVRPPHNMMGKNGHSPVANHLANRQAHSYTVLEKRDSNFLALVFKDWCRRMPYAHRERRTPSAGRD
jgi:hypothetical protein